jgi:Protein of unknown function (DUF3011)
MSPLLTRLIVHVLAPALAIYGVVLPANAGSRELNCESTNMRRSFCDIGDHGDIRLISSAGRWPCRQNETWGVESRGIWVDQNCRGRFSVDDPKSGKTGAIVAGVIGLGVLAALAAHNNRRDDDRRDDDRPPPDDGRPEYGRPGDAYPTWYIGRYSGYSDRDRQNLTMDIGPSGRVTSRGDGEPSYGRMYGNDQIVFDNGVRFYIERLRDGMRLTQVQDRRHVIELHRDR